MVRPIKTPDDGTAREPATTSLPSSLKRARVSSVVAVNGVLPGLSISTTFAVRPIAATSRFPERSNATLTACPCRSGSGVGCFPSPTFQSRTPPSPAVATMVPSGLSAASFVRPVRILSNKAAARRVPDPNAVRARRYDAAAGRVEGGVPRRAGKPNNAKRPGPNRPVVSGRQDPPRVRGEGGTRHGTLVPAHFDERPRQKRVTDHDDAVVLGAGQQAPAAAERHGVRPAFAAGKWGRTPPGLHNRAPSGVAAATKRPSGLTATPRTIGPAPLRRVGVALPSRHTRTFPSSSPRTSTRPPRLNALPFANSCPGKGGLDCSLALTFQTVV